MINGTVVELLMFQLGKVNDNNHVCFVADGKTT
nr:MAG TPA: hypothetical protein [Caudoviricetes sp.]